MPSSTKGLKVRILTWNMHDSVPKGNLEELLGKVPLYSPLSSSDGWPQLPPDANHPFHLVVVAGQECPSMSGMPMGLGAGFKFMEKDENDKRSPKYSETVRSNNLHEAHTSGWTFMVEDWLCHGGTFACRPPSALSPSSSEISMPKPLSARVPSREPKKGPYQLLIKERMMGIYLAIFIHRDLRHLVRAMHKSSVTAGLIGGRVGNKGGVGISVDIGGTSILFMNCHLAAHEGKVNHRIANLHKIKSELTLEHFLKPDDPRIMAEDLTDKFDYTFLFGDLNFRLDISRLHADWLISRQDYAQALAFDQLKNLMRKGQEFVGFNEASINFPPTFKYDVLRTVKRPKRPNSRTDRWKSFGNEHGRRITEVEEREQQLDAGDDDSDDDTKAFGEAASLASSAWTSMHSRPATENGGDDEELQSPGSRVSLSAAAFKTKWIALFSPPSSPIHWLKPKHDMHVKKTKMQKRHSSVDVTSNQKALKRATSLEGFKSMFHPSSIIERVHSTKSSLPSDDENDDNVDEDKGVYDSSTKKRVPSWCDRILWKSTVHPEPEDSDDHETHTRPRTRVFQFIAHAFRPLATRRRTSYSSTPSIASGSATHSEDSSPPLSPSSSESTQSPLTLHAPYVKSHEDLPTAQASSDVRKRSSSLATSEQSTLRSQRRATAPPLSLTPPTTISPIDASPGSHSAVPRIPSIPRWRFLPSFLSHTSTSSSGSLPASDTPLPPRKGDVVCLSYRTLDDKGMRRLEGRSDHRPLYPDFTDHDTILSYLTW